MSNEQTSTKSSYIESAVFSVTEEAVLPESANAESLYLLRKDQRVRKSRGQGQPSLPATTSSSSSTTEIIASMSSGNKSQPINVPPKAGHSASTSSGSSSSSDSSIQSQTPKWYLPPLGWDDLYRSSSKLSSP